ncbi:amino acid deaminase [Microbacterium candidum]|uniref:Amino acid deaminase n=1 Tax=Microbacterium candidum TaxID=3041922 RepID=A0ABT7MVP5_9MICO|nr:amino acid deaminase [Microbacterium sp. ASV49]MDL9978519.1 amino acid deaminase [Microbacterium sp. ASV49]
MDASARAALPLSVRDKSFPPASHGLSVEQFLSASPHRSDFATPLLTLDRAAMAHNVALMTEWASAVGVRLAPHGKTTMAPVLWQELFDAGVWALTLATAWQAQVARAHGVRRILIANEVVDPVALRWIAAELAEHEDVDILCWADGVDVVRAMTAALGGADGRLRVLVDVGRPGGRTGVRNQGTAREIAEAIAASSSLELGGVGGYEGAIAHGRGAASLDAVDAYLRDMAALHREFTDAGLYPAGARGIVTAGGSAYFDRVGAVLPGLCPDADVVVRAGAFHIHDNGYYERVSPMGRVIGDAEFRSAMHVWARVVSRPEPGLAILDCGKRDASFDEGMPVAQRVDGRADAVLEGSEVVKMNDQHAFLRLADGASLDVGDVVRLGLSHPCTVLDKWRRVPVVADADAVDPEVVDVVDTWF